MLSITSDVDGFSKVSNTFLVALMKSTVGVN
jgi:hypothetical protein